MFYGNSVLKQQDSVVENYDLAGSLICESVCMTEYNNRLIMYENCTDESERALLESQLEVLQEISIKDIGKKIIGALMKLWEHIKRIAKKIKDFITGARIKELKKRAEELEEKVAELEKNNAELGKENNHLKFDLKSKTDTYDTVIATQNSFHKIGQDVLQKSLDKTQSNYTQIKEKLNKIIEKAVKNKYIYFNPFDYLNIDAESSFTYLESQLKNYLNRRVDNRRNKDIYIFDPNSESINRETYYIIKKEFLDKDSVLTRDSGGETWMKAYIENDLEEKLETNKKKFTPIQGKETDFFKFIEDRFIDLEDVSFNSLAAKLSRSTETSAKIAKKYFEEAVKLSNKEFPNDYLEDEDKEEDQSEKYNQLKASYQTFNNITMCLRQNSVYLTGLCHVMGESVGALGAIVNSCRIILGMDAISRSKAEQK
jgi:FtsZ-binding cell division protein ZapB